ncbi:MAG TPA: DNA-3-methyladenine glycosylase [Candidatus Limnocylindria bacterium]|nr:DNA-3-methyladenine glycosylase [Candidatus Limnocylindria bacterium]
MRALIDRHGALDVSRWTRGRPRDPFGSLLRSIVGQQLSVAAARSIFARLVEANGGTSPTPEELLRLRAGTLRRAGLSAAKVEYVRDLARHVLRGDLELRALRRLDDEEAIERITAVKGLGRWTAEMFLMFHLRRPDVFPVGDLGVRRAIERAYGREMPTPQELRAIAERWRPYRTLASLYLWESLTGPPLDARTRSARGATRPGPGSTRSAPRRARRSA